MIPAIFYQDIYLILVAILSVFTFSQYYKFNAYRVFHPKNFGNVGALILTLFVIIFIGFRPASVVFPDMTGYMAAVDYDMFSTEEITWSSNFVFVPLMKLFSTLGVGGRFAIVVLAAIYFSFAYIALRKIFPDDVLFAMLVFLASFSTFASATNGMKAGCATVIFLCALAYKNNKLLSLFFLVLSLGFHHAAQLLIASYIVCMIVKNSKVYLAVWIICLLLSVFHVTYFQEFFGTITDEQGAGYLLTDADSIYSSFGGRLGFRWDFVLYGSFPIIIGYILIFKYRIDSAEYKFILHVYTLANAIWMLCMYASYTNRIAALSWGLYPVVIIYPFLKLYIRRDQYKIGTLVATLALAFTLFMNFIYY